MAIVRTAGLCMCGERLAHVRWGEVARAGSPVAGACIRSPERLLQRPNYSTSFRKQVLEDRRFRFMCLEGSESAIRPVVRAGVTTSPERVQGNI
eukprot:9027038-Alexandrium_andersonii.AAC.1